MILTIRGELPDGEELAVSVNGAVEVLTGPMSSVSFDVEGGKTAVEMEQPLSKSNRTARSVCGFLLTMLPRGILNCLMLNVEPRWDQSVRAYRVKGRLRVDMREDRDVRLVLKGARYSEVYRSWSLPKLLVAQGVRCEVEQVPDPQSCYNGYFNYVKRLVSVASVALAVLACILYAGLSTRNHAASAFASFVMAGILALVVALSAAQQKLLRAMVKSFRERLGGA